MDGAHWTLARSVTLLMDDWLQSLLASMAFVLRVESKIVGGTLPETVPLNNA